MNIAMAQSSSFFGNRRGSTKSHTYQVNGGQQITKDRVDEVKNPRSNGQMVHRCCLHTMSDAHAYLRPFIGGFWEGARSPQAALAAFRKANYPLIRAAADSEDILFSFSPYKETTKPIGKYQVSQGSLGFSLTNLMVNTVQSKLFYSRIPISFNVSGLKVPEVLKRFGLQAGDLISIVHRSARLNSVVPLFCAFTMRVLNEQSLLWSDAAFDEVFEILNESQLNIRNAQIQNNTLFNVIIAQDYQQRPSFDYVAAIVSRKTAKGVRFSTEFFKPQRSSEIAGITFAEAIESYPKGAGNVLDGGSLM